MKQPEKLKMANPVPDDDVWGSSVAGRAALASVLDRVDDDVVVDPVSPTLRRPWVYAVAGFAITLAALLPVLLSGNDTAPDPLALPGDPYSSINDDVLDDMFVTREELEYAASEVVQCTLDLSDNPEASVDYEIGSGWSVTFTTSHAVDEFEACHFTIFRGIEMVWAEQIGPPPAAGFYFYGAVVRCTEVATDRTFGELSQDSLGFVSTEGNRTINLALDSEPEAYDLCLDQVLDQQGHYQNVLACVAAASGTEQRNLFEQDPPTPLPENGRSLSDLTPSMISILDDSRAAHPEEFADCMGAVAGAGP